MFLLQVMEAQQNSISQSIDQLSGLLTSSIMSTTTEAAGSRPDAKALSAVSASMQNLLNAIVAQSDCIERHFGELKSILVAREIDAESLSYSSPSGPAAVASLAAPIEEGSGGTKYVVDAVELRNVIREEAERRLNLGLGQTLAICGVVSTLALCSLCSALSYLNF